MSIGDSLEKLSFDEWYELTLEEISRVEKQ
jgi:hypothetical protein